MRCRVLLACFLWIVCCLRAVPTHAQEPPEGLDIMKFGTDQKTAKKINDHIYQAEGFGNTYLVRTRAGNVIIDTSLPLFAHKHRQLLRAVDSGPVRYILLTHGHEDHVGGVPIWREPGTQVIAQRNSIELLNYQQRLRGFFAGRNAAQFGGAEMKPHADAAPLFKDRPDNPLATILFDDKYRFDLGELTFELYATPGETYDHTTIWIPQLKAAFVGDNYYASFPNMYTLRGTKPRWTLDYVASLNKVLSLKPEILLPGHGLPILGSAQIEKTLTRYRDAILYVHDATVRGMNEGKDVYTLMREIKLPPDLDVGEGYGKIAWSVRGIYEGYVGWFDGNPANMYDEPISAAYPDLVQMAGGADAVAARAKQTLDAGDAVKALHLADIALTAEPTNHAALQARLSALQTLLAKSANFNERGWLNSAIKTTQRKLNP